MRLAITVGLAIFLTAHVSLALPAKYRTVSKATYKSPGRAARAGAASAINRQLYRRGQLDAVGIVHARSVSFTRRGAKFAVRTKRNSDDGQPLAHTEVEVVKNQRGAYHFLEALAVELNLPIPTETHSYGAAAKAIAAKAFLGNDEVRRWFSSERGLEGAGVTGELKTHVLSRSRSRKTFTVEVRHREAGPSGDPYLRTIVKVRQTRSGTWKGITNDAELEITDLWE